MSAAPLPAGEFSLRVCSGLLRVDLEPSRELTLHPVQITHHLHCIYVAEPDCLVSIFAFCPPLLWQCFDMPQRDAAHFGLRFCSSLSKRQRTNVCDARCGRMGYRNYSVLRRDGHGVRCELNLLRPRTDPDCRAGPLRVSHQLDSSR